jgi:uncharacterized protein (DUF2384 family)
MTLASEQTTDTLSPAVASKGLQAVLTILDKWGCAPEQEWNILGMKRSTYYRCREGGDKPRLSRDQAERISYILNIHAALRVVFDNPENVYGFMSMDNNNPFFNGRTPMALISSGNFGALYEVFKRIDALRGGGL